MACPSFGVSQVLNCFIFMFLQLLPVFSKFSWFFANFLNFLELFPEFPENIAGTAVCKRPVYNNDLMLQMQYVKGQMRV